MAAMAIPKKRPTDNMELKADQPQEEEFALVNMSPYTFYNFWFYPHYTQEYSKKYLLFEDATRDEIEKLKNIRTAHQNLSMEYTRRTFSLKKSPPYRTD